MSEVLQDRKGAVSFSEDRFFLSSFSYVYDQSMSLVQKTAEYLHGKGRLETQNLSEQIQALYTAESMKLTTRLMYMTSWFLLHRALRAGEMSAEHVDEERRKVVLDVGSTLLERDLENDLPADFCALVFESLRMQERVCGLDKKFYTCPQKSLAMQDHNPVFHQLCFLREALAAS